MGPKALLGMIAAAGLMLATLPAEAQQTQSRLFEVTKNKKLRVCQFPLYYAISYRNPKTGQIEGIDADLSKELAKEGMTMLVVTHEMNFARHVGTRTVFMDRGEIVEEAPAATFFDAPRTDRAKKFLQQLETE